MLPGGFLGVDIFFVVSGFLITSLILSNTSRGTFSLREFYARRIKRIFPALVVALTATYLFGWCFLNAEEFKLLGKHIAGGAAFGSNVLLQRESDYFDKAAEFKPLLHLWSLGVEEQFYIFWPLLLYVTVACSKRVSRLIAWCAALALAITFIPTSALLPSDLFYFSPARFWELLMGAALANMYFVDSAIEAPKSGAWRVVIGLLLIAYSCVTLDRTVAFPSAWMFLPTIGTCFLISSNPKCTISRRCLSWQPLVFVGLISYPLYLWHWPLLSFARITLGFTPSVESRLLLIALSFVLAYLTYQMIERPIRFGTQHRATVPALACILLVIGTCGFATYWSDGFVWRTANAGSIAQPFAIGPAYRASRCFLNAVNEGTFAPECDAVPGDDAQHGRVFLWGDSHAAALYPGLKSLSDQNGFALAEYVAGGCPPLIDFSSENRPLCSDINRTILQKINDTKPDLVVVGAYWALYDGKSGWGQIQLTQIQRTLDYISTHGAKAIALVGTLPVFDDDQPKVAAKLFRPYIKNRTFQNFHELSAEHNNALKSLFLPNGSTYISPTDLLCSSDGCLISASPTDFDPIVADSAHLTLSGSRLLMRLAIEHKLLRLPRSEDSNFDR
jgi:peptidoglycan/LPS O-acetylase OafA/YrhL